MGGQDECTTVPRTTAEAIRLQGNQDKIKTKIYLLATGWQPSGFREYYDRVSKDPAWIVRTIDSGHEVMLNHPNEIASLLKEALSLHIPRSKKEDDNERQYDG